MKQESEQDLQDQISKVGGSGQCHGTTEHPIA